MDRRSFLEIGSASAMGLFVQACLARDGFAQGHIAKSKSMPKTKTDIALENRRAGLLDLPTGFDYVVLQQHGEVMSDGQFMPHQPDGMTCVTDAEGRYVLLRNHELGDRGFVGRFKKLAKRDGPPEGPVYDESYYGGVTRVVVDPARLAKDFQSARDAKSKAVLQSHYVLAGTDRNCAGGVYRDGWITCEESSEDRHGYAFLTKATDMGLVAPRRIDSWGRLHREGVAVDEKTGIAYMTEDRVDGCFYRHVPAKASDPLGPGQLQALSISGVPTTDPYSEPEDGRPAPPRWTRGQTWPVTWVDVSDPHAKKLPCRDQATTAGATQFMRGEGIAWDGRHVWFTASLGGPMKAGQIFKYVPDATDVKRGKLVLAYEVTDRSVLSCPDNVVMTPWGDLLMAEDNYRAGHGATHQYIRSLTADGRIFDLVRNRINYPKRGHAGAEFAGICFSPDGKFLFFNMQAPISATIAVHGPWHTFRRA